MIRGEEQIPMGAACALSSGINRLSQGQSTAELTGSHLHRRQPLHQPSWSPSAPKFLTLPLSFPGFTGNHVRTSGSVKESGEPPVVARPACSGVCAC